LRHPAEHLTDNYHKAKDSNNYKLLDLDHTENAKIWNILKLIEAWRDMDYAEGFTLDKIGKNVLELREGRPDPEYRKAIKIKIRGNLSAGLIEDLNTIAGILFGGSLVSISETWHQEDYNFEPAAVAIHLDNHDTGQNSPFWRDIAFITEIVKAGGVGLYSHLTQYVNIHTYHAAAVSGYIEAFITHNPDMGGETKEYSAAGANVFAGGMVVGNPDMGGKAIDYSGAGANIFADGMVMDNPDLGGAAKTHCAAAPNIFKEARVSM
jgi:hypothetical protein